MKKRILSLVLAILMIVSILPASTNAADVSSKPVCNCPEGYDVTNGHVATCPLFTCPRCGKAGCYDGVNCQPETEPEKHPMLGKTVKLNPDAGSYNGYMAEPTWSQMLMGKASYPTIMVIGEVLEKDGVAYCRLSAVEGTWAFPEYEDKIYLEATKLIVVTWCDDCGKYDCGIDHGTTEPTDPSVPEGEVSKITGEVTDADGNVLTDKDGNPIVITVEGDLPEGAVVSASVPNVEGLGEAKGIFDIKVLLPDGTEWQPIDEGKTVNVTIPVADIVDDRLVNVFHIIEHKDAVPNASKILGVSEAPDDIKYLLTDGIEACGNNCVAVEMFANIKAKNGFVSFSTNSFSIYVYDEENEEFDIASNQSGVVTIPNISGKNGTHFSYFATEGSVFVLQPQILGYGDYTLTSDNSAGVVLENVEKEGFWDYVQGNVIKVTLDNVSVGDTVTVRYYRNNLITEDDEFFVDIKIVREVTVKYDANGKTVTSGMPDPVSKIYATDGTIKCKIPEGEPTAANCTFKGWALNNAGTGTLYKAGDEITLTSDITFYAIWEEDSFDISFNHNFGDNPQVDVLEDVQHDTTIEFPAPPERENYTFLGWCASQNGQGDKYQEGDKITVTSAATYYAIWGADLTITISGNIAEIKMMEGTEQEWKDIPQGYFTQAGQSANREDVEGFLKGTTFRIKADGSSNFNAGAGKAYTSSGAAVTFWTEDSGKTLFVLLPNGVTVDTTITVTTEKDKFTVSYVPNGGTAVEPDLNVSSGTFVNPYNKTTKREGYSFEGWYSDAALTERVPGDVSITAHTTFYAKWKAAGYKISYDLDGGNLADGAINPETYTVESEDFTLNNPVKEGYTFAGWIGTDLNNATMVVTITQGSSGNRGYTATWTPNDYTYNVVYKSSTGKDLGSATVTNTFGTTNTITAPAKAGYTTPSAQNVVWDSTSKTITFIYAPIEYTIHYVLTSNGVTGTNHAGNPATYTIESGLITLKDPTPPANYKFVGWKEGNTIAAGSTGEKTFTAQWELLVADYKVETHVMDTNGKYVLESTKPHSATIGSEVSVTAEPREGFSVAANSVLSGTVAANGTTTLKIYYSRNQYTVTYKVDGKVDGEVDTVYYGSNVVVRTEPTKEGYTFSGWKIGSAAAADFTMPADHVVIEGNWSVNSYTYTVEIYTMDTSGQYSKPDTKTFTANYNADVSFEPEAKTGFSVADASVLSGKVPANNDLVLAVYYARNTYTVTWIADGTEVEKAYLYGKTIEKPENPSKQGYNFAGWVGYTENMTMPAENRTFTADWDPRTDTPYKVIHKQQNVTGDGYTVVETLNLTGTTDAEITPAVNTYEGFVSPSAVTVTIKPDGSTVVEYKYDREVYSVTYVADGTTVHTESVRYQGNVVNVPAVPEKTGYTQTAPTWNHNGQNITADTEIKAQYTINQYTITATMANGSVTGKADSYQHGASASVKFTPNTGYKITGVTVDGVAQSNFTEESYVYTNDGMTDHVQIVVTTELKTFTVTWNVDGKVTTETYPYGQTPDFKGSTDKPADAQFTYTFSGWSPKVVAVTGDATYTATYRQTTNAYTITWVDGNGKVIGKNTMEYGTTPTYNGATPTKTATAQYTYTFKGWDKEIVSVTGNETYTALFDAVVNCYTITWKNDNGVILGTTSVAYGELPTYNGATPTKAADAQYTYPHDGWTPSVVEVTGEATYTATYSAAVNEYTITFKNWDGTVLQTGKVPYGTVPVYAGATPIKAADNTYTYMWKGWDKTVAAVTGDAEYVAQFDATDRMYTITWKNWDGTELETDTAKYGETVKYDGAAPSKAPDQQYWYHFEGWTGPNDETFVANEPVTVTGVAAYTAVLNPKLQQYMVTWIVEGVTMEQKEWEYGQTPSFSYGEPTKAEDNGYTYSFKGWTPVIVPVVDRVEYKAIFEATQKVFNIEYVVEENGVAGTVSGNPATYTIETPDFALNNPAPTLPYYHFAGWSGTGITGMSDAVVIAKGSYGNRAYQAHYALNQYTITFNTNGADQATLAAVTYKYGDAVVLPAVTKKGYTFVWKVEATSGNWKAGDVAVSGTWEKYGDIQLIAEWTPNTYTIKFAANGGTGTIADMTMTYDIAKQLTPNAFTRTGYHFAGWKDENGNTYTDAQTVINLAAANDGVVTLFAQWEINTVSLYINTHNAIDANQTYIYTVSGTAVDGRSIRLTVAMGANDSQKIVNLPAGNYTISDQPEWSWRYAGQTVVHDVHADVVVDFNYTYSEATVENHYWLNNYGVELLQVNTTKRKK